MDGSIGGLFFLVRGYGELVMATKLHWTKPNRHHDDFYEVFSMIVHQGNHLLPLHDPVNGHAPLIFARVSLHDLYMEDGLPVPVVHREQIDHRPGKYRIFIQKTE